MLALLRFIHGLSIDCPNVVTLAIRLNMNGKQPSTMAQIQADCCAATGVTCDGNSRVTYITWTYMQLNGYIDQNAPKLLTNLIALDLSQNYIYGGVPSMPDGLDTLYLYGNYFTGPIPTLPSGLTHLSVSDNNMSGDVPPIPSTVKWCVLGYPNLPGNHFTGSVTLNRPTDVFINGNWIADIVIYDTTAIRNGRCNLSNTPLLGNPHISNLSMCTQNGLYSANLLPRTIFSSLSATTTELTQQ